MASSSDHASNELALARQKEVLARPMTETRMLANAVRALSIDGVEAAKNGHPGMPLGMADVATVLWTKFMKYDAADPHWADRDRFILSAGHGSMLLYSLLHLTGYENMSINDLKAFRTLGSTTAGHPERHEHPAIEMTTGPLGQGISTATGFALAEKMLAARFGKSLVDHRTWVIASDGDMMEGVSHEACAIAGHLALNKLTVLYDDNSISIDGGTEIAMTDDVVKRFIGYGWAARRIDGHDPAAIEDAIKWAMRSRKPTLIACKTIIGFGAPHKAGTSGTHGSPLGTDEAAGAKALLGWTAPPFTVPEDILTPWRAAGAKGAAPRRAWLKRMASSNRRAEFDAAMASELPAAYADAMDGLRAKIAETKPNIATRQASQMALEAIVPVVPEMVGGSADLTPSNNTFVKSMGTCVPGDYAGRYVHYGVREHGMATTLNGLALHGGIIPYGGTFFVFSDYCRPAIRLAAISKARSIFVLTHDSIGLGADGPTHQPIEHLASFRAMPNVLVLRPGDAMETAECWDIAMHHKDGPVLLVLSRQAMPALPRDHGAENLSARGGYIVKGATGARRATLIATGSEVSIAIKAQAMLAAEGIGVAVASVPSFELLARQDHGYRMEVLGEAPRIGIEAASGFGWERLLGDSGTFIGMHGFGASAPEADLYKHFGITPEATVAAVKAKL
ncbi:MULTISPECIES: transketolase [Acidiphilium]|uniref:Transketolase n=1 Tax=Acidiphilium rubrum TaxID=526 RepID=A0A8G2FF47_ACIRU|nr:MULTISPECIES: transketolase [Acidiphilium]SIR26941.1 transketolase [Acidiphilium rubrum]